MKQCPGCGAIDNDTDLHCGVCGTSLVSVPSNTIQDLLHTDQSPRGEQRRLNKRVVLGDTAILIMLTGIIEIGLAIGVAQLGAFKTLLVISGIVSVMVGGLSLSLAGFGVSRPRYPVREVGMGPASPARDIGQGASGAGVPLFLGQSPLDEHPRIGDNRE